MESIWIWAIVGAMTLFFLVLPVRVGFRVHAEPNRLQVSAIYNLGGPLKGSVRIPSIEAFKNPFRPDPQSDGNTSKSKRKAQAKRKPKGRPKKTRRGLAVNGLRVGLAILQRVERFEWVTKVGTGDAAYTSWCTGLLWAFKSGALSFLARHLTWVSAPRLQVIPDFDGTSFLVDLTCIFRFSIGEIILAAISYLLGRLRKGGL